MLMPAVSVTFIGLMAGLLAMALTTRHRPRAKLLTAVAGAWAGFAAGALPGISLDVAAGTGIFLPVVGHAGAAAGAAVALMKFGPECPVPAVEA